MFCEKTEYKANICVYTYLMITDYRQFERVKNFMYLGEIIQQNKLEQEATMTGSEGWTEPAA